MLIPGIQGWASTVDYCEYEGESEKERLALNTWGSEIGEWASGDEEEFLGHSRLVSRKLWS